MAHSSTMGTPGGSPTMSRPFRAESFDWISFLGRGTTGLATMLIIAILAVILGNIVFFNNFVVAMVLSPLLLFAIYPRVKRGGLRYVDILPASRAPRRRTRWIGVAIVLLAIPLGFAVGNLISTGHLVLPVVGAIAGGTGALQIGVGLLPVIVFLFIGLSLL